MYTYQLMLLRWGRFWWVVGDVENNLCMIRSPWSSAPKRVGVWIAHALIGFSASELSLADILFLAQLNHTFEKKSPNTPWQRGTAGASMPPKRRRRKAAKFLKQDRLSLIEDLRKEKYSDVVEKCINIVREGVHLKYCDSRRRLVDELTEGKARKVFMDFLRWRVPCCYYHYSLNTCGLCYHNCLCFKPCKRKRPRLKP